MAHVNKVSHVFTLSHVAEMLGEDEEWLFEVARLLQSELRPFAQRGSPRGETTNSPAFAARELKFNLDL